MRRMERWDAEKVDVEMGCREGCGGRRRDGMEAERTHVVREVLAALNDPYSTLTMSFCSAEERRRHTHEPTRYRPTTMKGWDE